MLLALFLWHLYVDVCKYCYTSMRPFVDKCIIHSLVTVVFAYVCINPQYVITRVWELNALTINCISIITSVFFWWKAWHLLGDPNNIIFLFIHLPLPFLLPSPSIHRAGFSLPLLFLSVSDFFLSICAIVSWLWFGLHIRYFAQS